MQKYCHLNKHNFYSEFDNFKLKNYLKQLLVNAGLQEQRDRYDEAARSYFPSYQVGRPRKLQIRNVKLYLKVFKQVRKSLKRGNQIDVAVEIKRLFLGSYNVEYWAQDEIEFTNAVILDEASLMINRSSLKGILKLNFWDYYGCVKSGYYNNDDYYDTQAKVLDGALFELAMYFFNASPVAMVQMRKRLLKNN